jgi:hypothetical protein
MFRAQLTVTPRKVSGELRLASDVSEAAFLRDGPDTLYADRSFRKGTVPSRGLSRILRVRS